MLNMITGTPGAGKTLYAVSLIDKQESKNQTALEYNASMHEKNIKTITDNDLSYYFLTHTFFSKITKQQETVVFEPDYFNIFLEKNRFEDIFLHIHFYNKICDKIRVETEIQLKQLKYVRHIYANIDGLKIESVRPMVEDWRVCPDGSMIFYDEIQLLDTYSADSKKNAEQSTILKMLTVHRHRAFDIYGITQFPRLVHTNFRDVVGLHYHLHRGWGAPSSTVYVWANCREKPNSLGNKFTAERNFRFNFPKRLYDIYESATVDTFRFRIPIKFLFLLLIPLFGIMMFSSMFFGENFLTKILGNSKPQQKQVAETTQPNSNTSTASQAVASDLDCRKKENITTPSCAQFLDDLLKNDTSSTTTSRNGQIQVKYNPSKPYDLQDVQDKITYDVKQKPMFAGCIKKGSQYIAYTQQGTIMHDVSQNDCKRLIQDNDRPFNYFKDNQPQQALQATAQNLPVATTATAQTQDQSKNVVVLGNSTENFRVN